MLEEVEDEIEAGDAMATGIVLGNLLVVVLDMPEYYEVANVNIVMELASGAGLAYIRRWIVWGVIAFSNCPALGSQQYKLLAGVSDT